MLAQLAMVFPEFRESSSWLSLALQRLEEHLRQDFFEDGGHSERAPRNYTQATYLTYRNLYYLLSTYLPKKDAQHGEAVEKLTAEFKAALRKVILPAEVKGGAGVDAERFAQYQRNMNVWINTNGAEKVTSVLDSTKDIIKEKIQIQEASGVGVQATARNLLDPELIGPTAVNNPFQRARLIARTETHNAAGYALFATSDSWNVEMVDMWVAAEDGRARPTHGNRPPAGLNRMQVKHDLESYPAVRLPGDNLPFRGKKGDLIGLRRADVVLRAGLQDGRQDRRRARITGQLAPIPIGKPLPIEHGHEAQCLDDRRRQDGNRQRKCQETSQEEYT
jgi:hypothetical protein